MLIKQIVRCKALSAKLTNFYLQIKNINMISKIIFEIRLRLFWFFLIRIRILIILSLIWINLIDILIIKIRIFHNMIQSDKIEWLQLIFSDLFILILITTKIDFLFKIRITWSRFCCSCYVNHDHQWLFLCWKLQLIDCFENWLTSLIILIDFIFSITVIVFWKSCNLLQINWNEIQLKVWNWLILQLQTEFDLILLWESSSTVAAFALKMIKIKSDLL